MRDLQHQYSQRIGELKSTHQIMDGFLPSRTITLPSEHFAPLAGSDPAASGGQRRLNESASTSPVERNSSEGDTRVRF